MTRIRTAGRTGALFIPIALLLAACGGATGSGSTVSFSASFTQQTAAPAPSTGAVETSAASDGAFPSFAIPSFDVGELTKGLENVDSYRVSMSIGGVEKYKGVVVTKPVLARDITIGTTRVVVIGDEAWVGEGTAPLQSVPAELAKTMFAAFDPTLLVGAFSGPQWAQSSLDKGTEQKNGVSAKHLSIDGNTAGLALAGLPPGATIDIWVADEGYLVAWESKGTSGGDMSIQVTGVDDPANKVERPS
jgi:hypothetical protein